MQSEKHTKNQLKGGISLKNVQNEKPGEAETRRLSSQLASSNNN